MHLDERKIEAAISPVKSKLTQHTARLVSKCASLRDAAELMQTTGNKEAAKYCYGKLSEHMEELRGLAEFSHRGLDKIKPYSYQEFFGEVP